MGTPDALPVAIIMVEENRPPPIDFSLIPENYGNENNPGERNPFPTLPLAV